MKVKSEYILRELAGQNIVVPVGSEAVNFNGIVTLNNSGKRLFKKLQEESSKEELIELLLEHYLGLREYIISVEDISNTRYDALKYVLEELEERIEELEKEKERLVKLWDAYKNQDEELLSVKQEMEKNNKELELLNTDLDTKNKIISQLQEQKKTRHKITNKDLGLSFLRMY